MNLFERLCSKQHLREAFKAVKKNSGAPGIDGQTVAQFDSNLDANLEQLKNELENWTYEPKPVKRVEIPKPDGGIRLLGIPCVRDRVVQVAIKALLEPKLDPQFSQNSYGFRPGRNQHHAVIAAKKIVESGKEYVVDLDLAKFFDTINHDRLISRLSLTISDKRILRLIGKVLRSGIMRNGLVIMTPEGATQGSPLSPLLSNVVLDELDKELERRGLEFCRYADDANIYVKTKKAADSVMQTITKFIESKLKLKVNKEKSKTAQSKDVKFLGFTIFLGAIIISALSVERAMAKVKELTPRGTSCSLDTTAKSINKWYMGWSAYYALTQYPGQLYKIEAHIRRRLRMRIVSQQRGSRNLKNTLLSRGLSIKGAAKTAYSGKGKWRMSICKGLNLAFSNRWFINEVGLKIRSDENRSHWFDPLLDPYTGKAVFKGRVK